MMWPAGEATIQMRWLLDMTSLPLRTPSRLPFRLLAWNRHPAAQFGGVGLMIERPGLELTAQPAAKWQAEGPLARRTLQLAERITEKLALAGTETPAARFKIHRAPPEHMGLGTGTQLGLAVARVLTELAGRPGTPV